MKFNSFFLNRTNLWERISRFGISGGFSAGVDYAFTMTAQHWLYFSPSWAKFIGFISGTTTAYLINRIWTFKAKYSHIQLLQVVFLYTTTLVIQVLLYRWFNQIFSATWFYSTISFIIAQGVATVINFVVQHKLIFNKTL